VVGIADNFPLLLFLLFCIEEHNICLCSSLPLLLTCMWQPLWRIAGEHTSKCCIVNILWCIAGKPTSKSCVIKDLPLQHFFMIALR
jgi:hypothetical protein